MRWLDRKAVILGLLAVVGLGLIMTLSSWVTADRRLKRHVAELKSSIEEEIPVGSELDSVLAFLQERDIEHSGYLANSQGVNAAIRNAVVKWPIYYGIFIRFQFDRASRLESYQVNVAGDAP